MNGYKENFYLKEANHQEILQILLSYFGHAEGKQSRRYVFQKHGRKKRLECGLDLPQRENLKKKRNK